MSIGGRVCRGAAGVIVDDANGPEAGTNGVLTAIRYAPAVSEYEAQSILSAVIGSTFVARRAGM